MKRRSFLYGASALAAQGCRLPKIFSPAAAHGITVNDVHSQLNETWVRKVLAPANAAELSAAFLDTAVPYSIAGYRHSMGGQQFAEESINISTIAMNTVHSFDRGNGIIEVGAGITWPQMISYLLQEQAGAWPQWGITQKQTGADNLSIGGSISSNIHGRGLHFRPFIQDLEECTLVNARGEEQIISRTQSSDLFRLVAGGYGLFGLIKSAKIRLSKRTKLQRTVRVITLDELPELGRQRIAEGYTYGDFQYKTDGASPDLMEQGVFSAYRPLPDDTPMPEGQRELRADDWNKLLTLGFLDKAEAFRRYSSYYLTTDGQRYWSDTHQLSYYNPDYRTALAKTSASLINSTLMITEVYVPQEDIVSFTRAVAKEAKKRSLDIIYGTMRLIRKDDETFLPWAKRDFACVIFNLRVEIGRAGMEKAAKDFQYLIDAALDYGGSYFLTYHRFARKDQVIKAYPQFPEFLSKKLSFDPQERFQSTWYRFYKEMFRAEI